MTMTKAERMMGVMTADMPEISARMEAARESEMSPMSPMGPMGSGKMVLGALGNFFLKSSPSTSSGGSSGTRSGFRNSTRAGRSLPHSNSIVGSVQEEEEGSVRSQEDGQEKRSQRLVEAQRDCYICTERLERLNLSKVAIRVELKEWEADFERRVGRPPSNADKSVMEDRFQAFQQVTLDAKLAAKDAAATNQRLLQIRRQHANSGRGSVRGSVHV
jgi:hypothetical protein